MKNKRSKCVLNCSIDLCVEILFSYAVGEDIKGSITEEVLVENKRRKV